MFKLCPKKIQARCCFRHLSKEQKLRIASESCMIGGGLSLVGAVATWMAGGRGENRAETQRLGIFIGLWVPSLLLTASYLTRKADDEAMSKYDEDAPYFEESM